MSNGAAEILRYLFGLPQAQIDADLATAPEKADKLLDGIQHYMEAVISGQMPTPDRSALNFHHRFLQAHALQQDPKVHEDVPFFLAATVAQNFADEVEPAAIEEGRLAELHAQIEVIEKREGLQKGEFWPIGEGPEDYQVIVEESDALHKQVSDRLVLEVLRRYRFSAAVQLLEEDDATFAVRYEVGRRLTSAQGENFEANNRQCEEYLLEDYGRQALEQLKNRLRKTTNLPPG